MHLNPFYLKKAFPVNQTAKIQGYFNLCLRKKCEYMTHFCYVDMRIYT